MLVPNELLEYLADQYYRACIDPSRYPFVTWAAVQAEKMGWRL